MLEKRRSWVGVVAMCVLFTRAALGGEDRAQLVATVRDGNRAAIQSIATMECRYERIPWGNTNLEQAKKWFFMPAAPGRFWRSGDVFRLIEPNPVDGTTREYVIRNGRMLALNTGGPLPHPILGYHTPRPVDGTGGEMWKYLLFSHWGWVAPPGASYYTFHEILDHPHVIHTSERLPAPGKQVHIELSHANGVLELWFDPKVNYLIRKSVMVPAGDRLFRWEEEVVEFAEPASGVFVPIVVEHRCSIKGEVRAVVRTVLTELKVNHRMPESALRIPGIAGMECTDFDRDVKFRVDASGTRVGAETPYKVGRVAPKLVKDGDPDPPSWVPPTRPSTPWWVWVLVASAAIFLAGIVFAVIRRRVGRAEQA